MLPSQALCPIPRVGSSSLQAEPASKTGYICNPARQGITCDVSSLPGQEHHWACVKSPAILVSGQAQGH